MHALYVISVFLHIIAATAWVGGMLFLVLVVVPWLRSSGRGGAAAATFLRETGVRFRAVGWSCFLVLVVTGTFNLHMRGVGVLSLSDSAFWQSPFGSVFAVKMLLFMGVLLVSLIHDFIVGPSATQLIAEAPNSAEAARVRKQASLLGRLNALFALAIVLCAVMLVRGWPF